MTWPAHDEDGFGPDDAARLTNVSRETLELVRGYLALLDEWRTRINLIGPNEGRHLWRRHALDSLQLVPLLRPQDKSIADLGTGAGFPGLVLACALAGEGRSDARITLVEKSPRKCEFLRAAARQLKLPADILEQRAEDGPPQAFDLVTARALSPLPRLLEQSENWVGPDGWFLFLKGREATTELAQAQSVWAFDLDVRESISSPGGQVLAIKSLRRRTA
jgi:16S rRNA (guanine527-N7)-methyltransferase